MGALATLLAVSITVSTPVPVGLPALAIVVLATTRGAAGTLVAAAFEAGPATNIAPATTKRVADVAPTRLRPRTH
jgi:hypothetical protein